MRTVLALALLAIATATAGCRASSTPTEPAECTVGSPSEWSLTCSMIGAAHADVHAIESRSRTPDGSESTPDRRDPQASSGPRAGGGGAPDHGSDTPPAPVALVGAACPRPVAPTRPPLVRIGGAL